jgi:hypothetical protein
MDSYEEMRRKEAEIEKMLEELSEAAYYEGTEVADTWMLLKETYEHLISDYVSDEFAMALEKEIREQYSNLKKDYEWIEEEEKVEGYTRTVRYLDSKI